ncbi:bifunctional diaminohydroxyphosphoribosylaminopyrimidine deaminase/5-amino-6-(5-phosphoribosylamino)uracil reductase RibD [Oleiagrimonas sp. MCCC 1A03011]|uniref:bifunctional diaminohydroxyphosphoribosylaminopyrimidine deaminase/5-amino-6-(5-phosphoribosylamino)uracil reductase RibD n=1 Tax=Oleiagrimonas sp. MCCC 1A03011 TaxID=1926883 RepID=UPI000DC261F6|nr:bifunctional diaminohydroxyphosphoribosylaminopyrimidine deaminase/5-amino-6-(5-phosphoribosylamino)uracil reductase RibD [Oleiagrimonas sp. MCCC 1A03011]RAP58649.1 riboflavin biosynthesis protein RibD [Oleiagrimonas sp. MCCC 1A03011]
MSHALRLAERGLFTTQPNPRVGCVIAHGEDVVGEGFHERAGEPHAEVHALRAAGERARGATAYVTLEPCGLHGRTPPCADALIEAGVVRVVMASEDTSQAVGAGLQRLRDAGIGIASGLMRDAARELNIGFFSRIERGRPFVRVKLAMSLDGRTALADGTSKWITGEAARNDVQRWRARSSAILTGSGTALADDPRLTMRLGDVPHVPPLRVVLDRYLRLAEGAHLLDGSAPTLMLHGSSAKPGVRFAAVECAEVPETDTGLDLGAVLGMLAGRGVNELHVEAGPTLCGALFAAGLVDELLLYVAPVLLGDRARPLMALPPLDDMARRWQLAVAGRRTLGEDLRLRLRPRS